MASKKHVQKKSEVFIPETLALETENEEKFKTEVQEIRKRPTGEDKRGVIYLGHIPRGFFEPQMREFFSQFGQVTRLRLSRSKKTGRSKGYAFIEFRHEDVARVVADTMNNYLMFIRLLKCQFIPEEKVHPDTFKGSNRKFSFPKSHILAAKRNNSVKSEAKQKTIDSRRKKKLSNTLKRLAELGVDYSLEQPEVEQKIKLVPAMVQTPKGKLHVLKEDLSDAEIAFRTPPDTIKSSRLATIPHVIKSASTKSSAKQGKIKAKTAKTSGANTAEKGGAVKKAVKAASGKMKSVKRLKH